MLYPSFGFVFAVRYSKDCACGAAFLGQKLTLKTGGSAVEIFFGGIFGLGRLPAIFRGFKGLRLPVLLFDMKK